jgi:hypothetical protein
MKVIFGISHRRNLDVKMPSIQVFIFGLSQPTKVRGKILGNENMRPVRTPVRTPEA